MKVRSVVTVGVLLLFFGRTAGQPLSARNGDTFDPIECPLHEIMIGNDTLTAAFRLAAAYYTELCDRKIRLQYGSAKTSMAARPTVWSVFRKRDHRRYKIIVNKDSKSDGARLIYAAPFDARVGVMGHELAHVLDYSTRSGWQIMWMGVRYLGKNYRRKMERQTDSVAIVRGFGPQLYRYAYFVIYEADVDDAYRKYKSDMYMKPEEIDEMIKNINP